MKLSTRLLLGMILLVFLTAAAFGVVTYRVIVSSLLPAQMHRLEADSLRMADRLASAVDDAVSYVLVKAAEPALDEIFVLREGRLNSSEATWKAHLAEVFQATLAVNHELLQVRLIGVEDGGREIIRVHRNPADGTMELVSENQLQRKGARPYFLETIALPPGSIYVSPLELNEEHGKISDPPVPVIRVSTPIYGTEGPALGIVVINIDMRPALDSIRWSAEPGIDAYVVNQAGDYLVHPDRNREFAFQYGSTDRFQDDLPEMADLLRPVNGEFKVSREVRGPDGEAYLVAGVARDVGLGVRTAVLLVAPRDIVMAPAYATLRSAAEVALLPLLLAVLLALVLSRTIARPLGQVTKSLRRFDHGEPVRLPLHAPKEIADLVEAFRHHIERERLFNAAVQSSTDAILTLSLDGKITAWNPAAEKLFGYSTEEIVGQPLETLVPADRIDECRAFRRNLLKGLSTGPVETVRLAKNGQRADVSLSVSPVRSLSGEVTGASASYRDVTARKQADAIFRMAVEASPAAMLMAEQDGRIVMANSEASNMFGFPPDELVGKHVEDLMPERIRSKHKDLRQAYAAQPAKRFMGSGQGLRGLRRDGSEFPLEVALNPIELPEGPMVLSVVVDITERQRAAAELEQRTDELKRSNAELQQFAFVASHDLQEPLRMVTSFCELLKERYGETLGEDGKEFVDFAVDGAQRMRQLINDLLDYSRLQTRTVSLTPVSAGNALDIALLNLAASITERNAQIFAGDLPTVMGNESQLVRVFQNLISNALKFTKGRSPQVEITAEAKHDHWLFTVRDNGIGIDPRHKDAIFGVFQRLHGRDEYSGTGIGLAVCKRIVDLHGGKIWVESVPQEGAAVHFTLKRADVEVLEGTEPQDADYTEEAEQDVRRTG